MQPQAYKVIVPPAGMFTDRQWLLLLALKWKVRKGYVSEWTR